MLSSFFMLDSVMLISYNYLDFLYGIRLKDFVYLYYLVIVLSLFMLKGNA